MKAHQRIALEKGLAEFDRSLGRRRIWRRIVGAGAVGVAVLAVASVTARLGVGPPVGAGLASRPLPAYVEIITDSEQVAVELELASACERIGNNEGRIYVVECEHAVGGR